MSLPDSHYRPQYHFSPPTNWLNDPNGLVYYRGEYHLFYQYHPGSSVWGPMHWGHAVSSDLVSWQHLPIALYPDENGMIYSGSAVIDWDNTAGFGKEAMVAVFTHHRERYESQSLAYSTDCGRSWSKYPGNPVLLPPDHLKDFRDPKVFWYGEKGSGHWVAVLAAGDAVGFYTSPDLIHWKPGGTFGRGHGTHAGVWETPDLFELPLKDGAGSRWVLTVGVGDGGPGGRSGMQYFVGRFDGETFASENPKEAILWMDFGADFYAAQSWNEEPHGRRIMIGWQNNWQYAEAIPTMPWRGVFSLPRELSLVNTPNGARLVQVPIPEVSALRGAHSQWQDIVISPQANLLEGIRGNSYEIVAEFKVNPAAHRFGFRVRVGAAEQTVIGYDVEQQMVFVDRTKSGESSFEGGFARIHTAEMAPKNGAIHLRIFVDRCSVEAFGNGGEVVISDSIFPDERSQGVELFVEGGEITLNSLDIDQLLPARFTVLEM